MFGLFKKEEEPQEIEVRSARLFTQHGVLEVELYEDDAPDTVNNFCNLAEKGFYRDMIFHRLIPNVLVQTGCPNGDGTGWAGYYIKCELGGSLQQHGQGVLSMAHSGRDRGSSQFFICLSDKACKQFDGNHTCFGVIKRGLELIDNFRIGDKLNKIEIIRRKVKID